MTFTKKKGWKVSSRRDTVRGGPKLVTRRAKDNPLAVVPEEVKAQAKLVNSSGAPVEGPIGRNTSPAPPRDRRVPVAEIDGLLVKTITVLGDTDLSKAEITRRGGASSTTLRNWTDYRTRRPLVSTLNATLKACGYKLAILDPEGKEL
ncbi:hypothetical protein HOU02_gp463 [Caulobacter phage CcrBL9]|uniref:Uncharacterized protein n=1 Tax=Caulobacter phage CcrBL9 TaxID=2283270 RepID=A0A385EEH9_9CAUD|nr:hypothetical protein HOU02_gp463 [Caulobacter phage CcrBL9]AXQ69262.1 hypothetical protein CcrBL9_gp238c [Caulobacter phage CcrBL9]